MTDTDKPGKPGKLERPAMTVEHEIRLWALDRAAFLVKERHIFSKDTTPEQVCDEVVLLATRFAEWLRVEDVDR